MINHLNQRDHRYERKFHLENTTLQKTISTIKQHPAFFKEIFHKRQVNNIYFDSHNFQSYHDNIAGQQERIKIRIRWYGKSFDLVKSPVLEIKIKNGHLGTKASYPLKQFYFDKSFNLQTIHNTFQQSQLPKALQLELPLLRLTLFNTYTRQYFQTINKKFRLTIDSNLEFCNLNQQKNLFLHKHKNTKDLIVELKYKKHHDLEASSITKHFPFQLTKSSKYVTGVQHLHY